uniref:Uncharacterized protein n=1 Tax=Lepeophtheirus salmonis TaxID=72036 RepID=A0A0K2TNB1_LEPSM
MIQCSRFEFFYLRL